MSAILKNLNLQNSFHKTKKAQVRLGQYASKDDFDAIKQGLKNQSLSGNHATDGISPV